MPAVFSTYAEFVSESKYEFGNNCWINTLAYIARLTGLDDIDLLALFDIASEMYQESLSGSETESEQVKLGHQVPIEIVDIILTLMNVRIQVRHSGICHEATSKGRWIGADFTLSTIVVTDFYICHSGNLESETGHYSVMSINAISDYDFAKKLQEEEETRIKQIRDDEVYARLIAC